jgi:hypothetical protein
MDIDQLFSGMAKADASGRGTFMKPGLFVVETKSIFVKDGFKGKSFIVEFTIVESNTAEHKPGTAGSWILKFKWPATFGHITRFVYALLANADPELWRPTKENLDDPQKREIAELYARAMCGSDTAKKELGEEYADGMFIGQKLKLETTMQKTNPKPGQPEGGDFTAYSWAPFVEAEKAAA